ncbi:hypothetical protein CR162_15335 [Pseudoroseomonas rhizosphaerae]|uniref:Uncharacterized protein n=1 Tax=Teichococcus rhizosphaerae TaxID=1335062 RepID=A0A2C7AAN3_9PROT|nr:hypothetical protein [Pseudoroseomonas rhizosphaerae]PHK94134.1 hypothetical protein CR162_15335 [Pseudoroseomonas rhizosphaerae]
MYSSIPPTHVAVATSETVAFDRLEHASDTVRLLTGPLTDSAAGTRRDILQWTRTACEAWEQREPGAQSDQWVGALRADGDAYALCEPSHMGGWPLMHFSDRASAEAECAALQVAVTGCRVVRVTVRQALGCLLAAGGAVGAPWWFATSRTSWCIAPGYETPILWLNETADLRGRLYRVPVADFVARLAV